MEQNAFVPTASMPKPKPPSLRLAASSQITPRPTATTTATDRRPQATTTPDTFATPSPHPLTSPVESTQPNTPPPTFARSETTVVWFRDDLRLHDNPALTAAIQAGDSIAALVLLPRHDEDESPFRTSCLHDLRTSLRRLNGELFIRRLPSSSTSRSRKSATTTTTHEDDENETSMQQDMECKAQLIGRSVANFCEEVCATRLHYHRGVSAADVRAEELATTWSQRVQNVTCAAYWTGALHTPDELPFAIQATPDDCDEFGTAVSSLRVREPLPVPTCLTSVTGPPPGHLPAMRGGGGGEARENGTDRKKQEEEGMGGEQMGLQRVRDYVEGRGLVCVHSGATPGAIDTKFGRLGPFLSAGCISPRLLWHEVMMRVSDRSLRRFCAEFELVLRDFVRMVTLKRGMLPA